MAIVAVIMSVNFTACSDDDDEGEGNNGTSKKFISATYESGDASSFEYDNQGRITKEVWDEYELRQEITEFTYEANRIIATAYDISSSSSADEKWITNYELKDGIIASKVEYNPEGEAIVNVKYNYDSSKQLVSIEYSNSYNTNSEKLVKFIWQNGNITSMFDDDATELSYTSLPYQFLGEATNVFDPDLINNTLFAQGFYGKCLTNLVKTERGYDHYDYIYTTDEEGYVTKVIMEYEDGDQWACYCSWK